MTAILIGTFYLLNEITAIAGIFVLSLCFRGYWPHIRIDGAREPRTWITLMILWVCAGGVIRMLYWDLWRTFYAYAVSDQPVIWSIEGTLVNAFLNFSAFWAGLFGLSALYYAIPDADRATGKWNIFNAYRYPNDNWFLRWQRTP